MGRETCDEQQPGAECFLCLGPASSVCGHCGLVAYCGPEHYRLHRDQADTFCFPYRSRPQSSVQWFIF